MTLEPHTSALTERLALLLVVAVLVVLPLGRLSELPVLIAGISAVVMLLRGRLLPDHRFLLVAQLFACYALAIALSGFAAVAPAKTWSTAAATLRLLPFAAFVVFALRHDRLWPALLNAVAALLGLWLLDAWVQIVFGYSLAGAPERERLAGIFGADNLKLGPVLATLSPFVLLAARRLAGRVGLLFAFVALLVPILLAGARAAWLTFGLVCVVVIWRETRDWRRFLPLMLGAVLLAALLLGVLWRDSSGLDARMQRSLRALQGTSQGVDEALAGRVGIWRTALRMTAAHPLSGVGARGFRYAYPAYADVGDQFVDAQTATGAAHAHQIVLEIVSETGLLGLALWLLGAGLAVRAWRRASAASRERAFAPALALAVMCFPFNTHYAFYSAWWGLLFWWLLAVYCAALSCVDGVAAVAVSRERSSSDQLPVAQR